MENCKAMIAGCAGVALTDAEIAFFGDEKPWGLILFARNIGTAENIRALTGTFRTLVGRADAPVFIDQEGGRVQRIKAPLARAYPPGEALGALYRQDRAKGLHAARLMSRLLASDLLPLGINADCLPVLDVPQPGADSVIGDRAYGHDPVTVAELGHAAATGLLDGGVLPVIKHIPGHGRAMVDSHKALPRCNASRDDLEKIDFAPFRDLADMPMAMTAHVVYEAYDSEQPATHSRTVIDEVIRGFIGFDGLLMTDDLSMHALSGDFSARAERSFAAGCDIVLHCNGVMEEMQAVAAGVPQLAGRGLERATETLAFLKSGDAAGDMAALHDEFDAMIGSALA